MHDVDNEEMEALRRIVPIQKVNTDTKRTKRPSERVEQPRMLARPQRRDRLPILASEKSFWIGHLFDCPRIVSFCYYA